jgi:hypothetical protein
VRQRALLDLADQLLYEPCYDTLRTKEQLGYTVSSGSRLTHGIMGFCVVVVSAKHNAQVGGRLGGWLASRWQQSDACSPKSLIVIGCHAMAMPYATVAIWHVELIAQKASSPTSLVCWHTGQSSCPCLQ